jgi:hypothetical protein
VERSALSTIRYSLSAYPLLWSTNAFESSASYRVAVNVARNRFGLNLTTRITR